MGTRRQRALEMNGWLIRVGGLKDGNDFERLWVERFLATEAEIDDFGRSCQEKCVAPDFEDFLSDGEFRGIDSVCSWAHNAVDKKGRHLAAVTPRGWVSGQPARGVRSIPVSFGEWLRVTGHGSPRGFLINSSQARAL
ncbi:MAG: hypothetical protein JNN08_07670 [Bryobacterales bacterium]|nr:hypothetical protein [Bryobacterales bacterium]